MINWWPVQQAIYSALTTAPATYPVYDAVPQGAAFPYLVIGAINALPGEELATPTGKASFLIDAFSRQAGKSQAHAMLAFVRARLNGQDIGAGVTEISEDSHDVIEDRNSTAASRLYHGFARYLISAS